MSAQDPILAAACRRVGCAGAAQDRHDGYCSERCRKRDQKGGNSDTLIGDGGTEQQADALERIADAMERQAELLEIQNSVLLSIAQQNRRLVRAELGMDPDGWSYRGMATGVEDNALHLHEQVDLDAIGRAADE